MSQIQCNYKIKLDAFGLKEIMERIDSAVTHKIRVLVQCFACIKMRYLQAIFSICLYNI